MEMKVTDQELMEWLQKKKTATEIANIRGMSKQAVSKRIKKLRIKSLIEIDRRTTLHTRRLKCGNHKYYKLTDLGYTHLQKLKNPHSSSRGALDDASALVDIRFPQLEKHAYRVKIKIVERGIKPPGHKENSKLNNWTLIYGKYAGCRYEITPRNIFITARTRGRTREQLKKRLEDKIDEVVQLFLHLGWSLKDRAEVVNDGKIGVIYLLDKAPPNEGKLGCIDRTPVNPTIHPNNEQDADGLIKLGRFFIKNEGGFNTLFSKCPLLGNEVADSNNNTTANNKDSAGGDKTR